jgi:hypothetical protein
VRFAQALAQAGGHPPPSPKLSNALAPAFSRVAERGEDDENSALTWLRMERRLAGSVLKAANAAKRTNSYEQFVDDVACVMWWLRDAKVAAPRQSLPNLIRVAKAWEADQVAIAKTSRQPWWHPQSVPCPDGVHEAVLISSPEAVLVEAAAMRNCLRRRLALADRRTIQLWSVRSKQTGKRVAVIELRRTRSGWRVGEVAGKFNCPPPAWVCTLAEVLAARVARSVSATQIRAPREPA